MPPWILPVPSHPRNINRRKMGRFKMRKELDEENWNGFRRKIIKLVE
jgi:hypothetical protein